MIKYNNNSINDWYFYTSDIVKVYRNNAVRYQKIYSGSTATWIAKLTLNDGSSVTIEGTGNLTRNETSAYSASAVSVELGPYCTGVGISAFTRFYGITSIDIPSNVTSIGSTSFYFCTGLTSVNIPNTVTSIGTAVFQGCAGALSITWPDTLTNITDSAIRDCTALTAFTIPNTVTRVGVRAFSGDRSLTNITIPSGVTAIGEYAFYACSGLTSITVEAATPPTLGSKVFDNTDCPIYVPAASVETYKAARGWSNYASRIQAIQ